MVEALSDQLRWPPNLLAHFPTGWGRDDKFLAEHRAVQALLNPDATPAGGWPLSVSDLLTRHGRFSVPVQAPLVVGYGCRQGDEAQAVSLITQHLAQRHRLGLRSDHWRRLPMLTIGAS